MRERCGALSIPFFAMSLFKFMTLPFLDLPHPWIAGKENKGQKLVLPGTYQKYAG
jgi:hypothetical protein